MSPEWQRVFWCAFGFWHGYLVCWITPALQDWAARKWGEP